MKKDRKSTALSAVFTLLCILYLLPVLIVLANSFKNSFSITLSPFRLPDTDTFVGWANYENGIRTVQFFRYFGTSLFITVGSVALIILCCSMCAWYIARVRTFWTRLLYGTFVFSMVVPFQMVMFTLSKTADFLRLNTPWGILLVYLGFGAGLAVFLFTGFMAGVPLEVEEAAMIDGCSPPATFFRVVFPILKPAAVSAAILETMWIWNDYLLPYLVLDLKRFKTVPIVIQYLRGGYGRVDMGAIMACLVLTVVPVVIFYLLCQKYIVAGVTAGAVKG